MEIKIKARGPGMKLESKPHSEEEDDEEEIPIISSNINQSSRNTLSNLRGKWVVMSHGKIKKKSKEPAVGKVSKKKRNLLLEAASTGKKAQVYLVQFLPYSESFYLEEY